MLKKYQTAMQSMELTNEAKERIRANLSAHGRAPKRCGKVKAVLAVAAVVMVVSCAALAACSGLFTFLSGGVNDGGLVVEELVVLIRAEGERILLTTPQGEVDITGLCSESEPYIYSFEDGDGAQHHIIAGGTAERCGFVEYIVDPLTGAADGQGFLGADEEAEVPAWLVAGQVELGIRPEE